MSRTDILRDSMDGEMIKLTDRYYPVIRAKDFYHLPGGTDAIDEGILLWLESGDLSYCLFVDELLGEQQIVVKPLPSYINNFNVKIMESWAAASWVMAISALFWMRATYIPLRKAHSRYKG